MIIIALCSLVGVQAEEYSVVLIQPEFVDDLNLPWTVVFAVCQRHPNSINVNSTGVLFTSSTLNAYSTNVIGITG